MLFLFLLFLVPIADRGAAAAPEDRLRALNYRRALPLRPHLECYAVQKSASQNALRCVVNMQVAQYAAMPSIRRWARRAAALKRPAAG